MSRYIFVKNLYRMLEDTSGINSNNEIIANINYICQVLARKVSFRE